MAELLAEPDQASGSKRKATALVHHEHCKRGKGKTPKNVYRWRFNGNMIYRWAIDGLFMLFAIAVFGDH
jgi:hypothetical protein